MSGGGGGGNFFKPIADVFSFGQGATADAQAGGGAMPPGSGDTAGQRIGLRDKISHDKTLDSVAKNDLLAQIDANNSDPVAIQQKYADILDPEKQAGKDMLYRKDRLRQADQPGLKQQTNFADSFLGGGARGSDTTNPFEGLGGMSTRLGKMGIFG